MKTYGVIMAGGGGTRFWPLSRKEKPKQFLNLTGKEIMVNETIDRLSGIVEKDDIFIVTSEKYGDMTLQETGGRILKDHILAEPAARNTAACIGYAAMEILKKYGDGVMCVFPSDHHVREEEAFRQVIKEGVKRAEETDSLVTIGIKPLFPATGYGYIKRKADSEEVEEFVEKPDAETARKYLKQGSYLWNSGMFIWKASVILEKFRLLLPDIYEYLEKIGQVMGTEEEARIIQEIYPAIPKISVDYGIMERADRVLVLPGDFGWSDVGSWDALGSLYEPDAQGNVRYGETVFEDVHHCIAYGQNKLISLVGVKNLVVVETDSAVLVCDKDRTQDVKKIVEKLENAGKQQYL